MNPTIPLKLSAIAYAVLWSGWMFWWSGNYDLTNIIILVACDSIAAYLWYRVMRWSFRRMSLLPHDGIHPSVR